jgi:hypothetical protein
MDEGVTDEEEEEDGDGEYLYDSPSSSLGE